MASIEARVKKLEKRVVNHETRIKKLKAQAAQDKKAFNKLKKEHGKSKKQIAQMAKWIKAEVAWSKEVTAMLRLIDWAALAVAFPGVGGTNPPQTPPDWPPPEGF